MNENVENLILVQLREMRGEVAAFRSDLNALRAEMRDGFSDVNQKVDGLSLAMTMLMGHVAHRGARVEELEEKNR